MELKKQQKEVKMKPELKINSWISKRDEISLKKNKTNQKQVIIFWTVFVS